MGIFDFVKGQRRTEFTAADPGAADLSDATIRPGAHATSNVDSNTALTADNGNRSAEPTILGPNVPVAGVATVSGNRTNAPASTKSEKDGPLEPNGHVTSSEKEIVGQTGDGNKNDEEEAEDESKYPTGFSLVILTFGLCMAIFVVSS